MCLECGVRLCAVCLGFAINLPSAGLGCAWALWRFFHLHQGWKYSPDVFITYTPSIHNHTVFTTSGLPKEPSSLKKAVEQKPFLADFREDCVRFRNYSSSMTSFNKKTATFHFDLCFYRRSNKSLAGRHHENLWTFILPKKKKRWWLSQWFSIHMRMFVSGH